MEKPYWYRTSFDVPAADKDKIFQLIFKGINYRRRGLAEWKADFLRLIADGRHVCRILSDVSRAIIAGKKKYTCCKKFIH